MTIPENVGATTAVEAGVGVPLDQPRPGTGRRAFRDPSVLVPTILLLVIVFVTIIAPLLSAADPIRSSIADSLAPPSARHPLGGDGVGRDVLARLLFGGRESLLGALLAVVVATVIGGPLGLIAGYAHGWFDSVTSWFFNLVMAIPGIIVLLVVIVAFGNNIYLAMAVFGVLLAPNVFRLVRAAVVAVRNELYIDAAKVAGLSDARIMRRHVIRVVVAPVIIQAAQLFGIGIVAQAGLEFLGLGDTTSPSWGAMLNDAFANIYQAPLLTVWPSIAIVVTVVLASLLASGVRDLVQGHGTKRSVVSRRRPVPPAPSATGHGRPNALLEVEDLKVQYGDREVVHGVSFHVERGEVLGIVGETGSGKSQTAFSILGLLPSSAERKAAALRFGDEDLLRASERTLNTVRGRRIGYIPQEPMTNLDPAFTVESQLVEPMRRHLGISAQEARSRAADLLGRVGIRDPKRVLGSYPHELSGGMAQRVLIAGAVSCEPEMLIADEPTTALDVTVQAEVLEVMRSLQRERSMAMIIVTHDLGVVADICDRVIVMRSGEVVETGTVDDLFHRPQHEFTRALLASTLVDAEPRPQPKRPREGLAS
jgi:peptide/nickel transport system permease protein